MAERDAYQNRIELLQGTLDMLILRTPLLREKRRPELLVARRARRIEAIGE